MQWKLPIQRIFISSMPVYVSVPYTDAVARVVVKAKENGNRFAQNLLAKALLVNLRHLLIVQEISRALVVPIPSSRSSLRRRGEDFLLTIVEKSLSDLPTCNSVEIAQLLYHRRRVADQSGLNQEKRQINMYQAFGIKGEGRDLPIIIVDDVVTTGSTILAAFSAFHEAGFTVAGAIAACASAHRFPIR